MLKIILMQGKNKYEVFQMYEYIVKKIEFTYLYITYYN